MQMKINILGTTYTLDERTLEEDKRLYEKDGYFDPTTKECVVIKEIPKGREYPDEFDKVGDFQKYKSEVKRHEIIHAFLKESGVGDTFWGSSEDMVNWLAVQFPKIEAVFLKANCTGIYGDYDYKEEFENPKPGDLSMAYFYHGNQVTSPTEFQKSIQNLLKEPDETDRRNAIIMLMCGILEQLGYGDCSRVFLETST